LMGAVRRTLLAILCALAGALIGGTLLWFAAAHDQAPSLLRFFAHLPGVNRELVAETGQAMYRQGPSALFSGGLLGFPYKLFAVHAGAQGVPLSTFLLISIPARLVRFSITATLAWVAGRCLKRWTSSSLTRLHVFAWLCIYALHFVMVGR
jgi:membrane protein DedA with SNARE-associated domain